MFVIFARLPLAGFPTFLALLWVYIIVAVFLSTETSLQQIDVERFLAELPLG